MASPASSPAGHHISFGLQCPLGGSPGSRVRQQSRTRLLQLFFYLSIDQCLFLTIKVPFKNERSVSSFIESEVEPGDKFFDVLIALNAHVPPSRACF